MITFDIVSSENDIFIKKIYTSYCETFPADERRNENQFYQLFQEPHCKIITIHYNQCTVGYLIIWEFDEFTFLEHFEIFQEFRNQKLGSKVLLSLTEIHPKILLESEPAHLGEIAFKRIEFYKRNGFRVLNQDYIQPAYDSTKKDIKLWLLGNYEIVPINTVIKKIHELVYGKI